ncbi:MAG: hypothetical protein ACRCW4_00260 [Candidatus Neomicrothrix subdominans]
MPRTFQAPKAVQGQPYGEAGDQLAAQRAIPLPNQGSTPTPSLGSGPTSPAPGQPTPQGQPDLLALAAALEPGPILTDPTQRPDEPVTAGLPVGPGAGPEAIASFFQIKRNAAADQLEMLANFTGDPAMQRMAQLARMRG